MGCAILPQMLEIKPQPFTTTYRMMKNKLGSPLVQEEGGGCTLHQPLVPLDARVLQPRAMLP